MSHANSAFFFALLAATVSAACGGGPGPGSERAAGAFDGFGEAGSQGSAAQDGADDGQALFATGRAKTWFHTDTRTRVCLTYTADLRITRVDEQRCVAVEGGDACGGCVLRFVPKEAGGWVVEARQGVPGCTLFDAAYEVEDARSCENDGPERSAAGGSDTEPTANGEWCQSFYCPPEAPLCVMDELQRPVCVSSD